MGQVMEAVKKPVSVATAAPARKRRSMGRRELTTIAWQIALAVALLLLWEYATSKESFWFSKPSRIWAVFLQQWHSGLLVKDLRVTFQNTMVGYFIGGFLGVALGFVLANAKRLAEVLSPFVVATYGIPRIALAPLVIVWFGIGDSSKIFLAAMMTFFLTFFNTYEGVRSVEVRLLNVAKVMGATPFQMVYKVIFPAASPWIISGLRVSIPNALVSAIVGEFIAANVGIGYRINYFANTFNATGTMYGVLVLMVIVLVLNKLLDQIENYLLRWRPTENASTKGT